LKLEITQPNLQQFQQELSGRNSMSGKKKTWNRRSRNLTVLAASPAFPFPHPSKLSSQTDGFSLPPPPKTSVTDRRTNVVNLYIRSLVLSGGGRPFHPSRHPSSSSLDERGRRRRMAATTILSKCDQLNLLASLLVVRSLGRCERWRPPMLAFPWCLILLPPNLNSVSYIHPRSKDWQRGSTSLFATEDEIQRADSSKYFGLWRFREWHWTFFGGRCSWSHCEWSFQGPELFLSTRSLPSCIL
jgi:hypothetical protein